MLLNCAFELLPREPKGAEGSRTPVAGCQARSASKLGKKKLGEPASQHLASRHRETSGGRHNPEPALQRLASDHRDLETRPRLGRQAGCCDAGSGVVSPACLPVCASLQGQMPDAATLVSGLCLAGCVSQSPRSDARCCDAGSGVVCPACQRHSIDRADLQTQEQRETRPRSQRHSIWHLTVETGRHKETSGRHVAASGI